MSRVWEILDNFKHTCRLRGWRTSESEDWVEVNNDYHNFLWTRHVSSSFFKAVISDRKCVVRKGLFYNVVEPSHLAWLFSEAPSEDLAKTVIENPDFSKRIAIFDLSPLLEGKKHCTKLNDTDSPVFQQFEAFLQNELKIKCEPFQSFTDSKIKVRGTMLPEFA